MVEERQVSKENKPMLDVNGQIEHLSSKGIKFDLFLKNEALTYLTQNSNYFKLSAYRKNYYKHLDGENAGKYINLDFAYLKDIAVIDMALRYLLIQMALDIEHFAKVKLLNAIANSPEDGYSIVSEFIDSLPDEINVALNTEFERNSKNPYCGDIIRKYKTNGFPAWAFVEVISLGRFISFYYFCSQKFSDKDIHDDYFLMLAIKDLRNAAAHNNCLSNDLHSGTSSRDSNYNVTRELGKIENISKTERKRKMSNIRVQQIVTLLYTHKKLIASAGVYEHRAIALQELISNRIFRNISYYSDNDTITTTFNFLKKVVDSWYPVAYTKST